MLPKQRSLPKGGQKSKFIDQMRRKLIVANWKMHKNANEVSQFFALLTSETLTEDRDVVIAPSFTVLSHVVEVIRNAQLHIDVGAQNVFYEDEGAFTGEVSGLQLANIGCKYVIIGHSERRAMGEKNDTVQKKIAAALRNSLTPIVCVGENAAERAAGEAKHIVERQIAECFAGFSDTEKAQAVVAYEPIWAIGTGKHATAEDAEDMIRTIHAVFPDAVRVLYGGSVDPQSAPQLLTQPSIDGLLVGGASLEPHTFARIVNA